LEFRELGRSGERVSVIGLGTWQFSDTWGVTSYEAARDIIAEAHSCGINFIDTAAVYGMGMSEEFVGRAVRELGIRDEVFIATKIPGEFLARDDVFKAVNNSLKRLQVDVIDLMQVHWPPCWHNIPTCEYMRALEQLVNMGLIRYIGLSDFPVELIESARECLSTTDIVSIQIRYNLVERDAEKEHIPYALLNDLVVIPWSPLAKGALTGKYSPDNLPEFQDVRSREPLFTRENMVEIYKVVEVLQELSSKYNKSPAQLALRWLIDAYPNIIPIPGAKSPEQARDNAGVLGWKLTYEDWLRLDQVSRSVRISRVTY
jgi:aryl-alcohol dehydrogenase-like predicted oxidoreductase